MNIVLIGFMGSGKSSIGRLLAKQIDYYFLDTDAMIESSEALSVARIFLQSGEEYFRKQEKKTLKWLNKNVDSAIISLGGGTPLYCDYLREIGKVIYLRTSFETLLSRMSPDELAKRPLFKDKQNARAIHNQRDLIYKKNADIIIDADADKSTVLAKIIDELA